MNNNQVLNETFTVTVNLETGETEIDVAGSDGQSCMKATSALERVLGGNVKRILKSEALNRLVTRAKQSIGLGA